MARALQLSGLLRPQPKVASPAFVDVPSSKTRGATCVALNRIADERVVELRDARAQHAKAALLGRGRHPAGLYKHDVALALAACAAA